MSGRPFLVAAALALVPGRGADVGAQTLSLNHSGSGARAAGMANAFIAVSDDGTAASWNPAGLAPLRQPEFSLVYVASGQTERLSGLRSLDGRFAFSNIDSTRTDASLDFASAAVPFTVARRAITVQAGWHRLYQLGALRDGDLLRLPVAGGGDGASVLLDRSTKGHIDVVSLAGAVKVTGRLSVGGSLDLWRGGWKEKAMLVETPFDVPAEPSPLATRFAVNSTTNRVRGHSGTVGVLLSYPSWNVGLVYHAPFWASFGFDGDVRSSEAPPLSVSEDGGRFRFPRSMGAGLAWRPVPGWRLAFDLTHDRWTELVVDIPGQGGPLSVFDGMPPEFSSTRDTVSFHLGAERLFIREGSVIPLRFGAAWEPQGASDSVTRDPLSFVMVAGGGGFNTNSFKLDAALQYRMAGFRAAEPLSVAERGMADGIRNDAVGQSRVREWRIKVSAIYRLQDTGKLRGLLRRIFG
jgi:hypothetical protein